MKLASLKVGRDGRLVVVSRDLTRAVEAVGVAPTLQAALDDWTHAAPRRADLAHQLEINSVPSFRFHEHDCASPLPRAYQWIDSSAYPSHLEIGRKARNIPTPASFFDEPPARQGGSDAFIGPRDPMRFADEKYGIDFEAEIAIITGDVPVGIGQVAARDCIKLILLANDVSLRNLQPAEREKGLGAFQSKPPCAFSPVVVTPDELGAAWDGAKLSLPVLSTVNGRAFGRPDAGRDMAFDLPRLVAHAARTRPLGAGTIIGAGVVSNRGEDGGFGRPVGEGGLGFSCISEQRSAEMLRYGEPRTPFLKFGDVVRIEMKDAKGHSIFGAIEHRVERLGGE
ncbi:MAG: 2-keto-4-pentenoate hydratase [Rhizobiales bacterium 65-9]|nr:fumarylacetoacetate hydrolase family protein [Hyphomicrobiales bacterium]OJY33221.1 MAG: 2-keto-4-pentenoate hydratase [Rhizobiales bacterium 65-9]